MTTPSPPRALPSKDPHTLGDRTFPEEGGLEGTRQGHRGLSSAVWTPAWVWRRCTFSRGSEGLLLCLGKAVRTQVAQAAQGTVQTYPVAWDGGGRVTAGRVGLWQDPSGKKDLSRPVPAVLASTEVDRKHSDSGARNPGPGGQLQAAWPSGSCHMGDLSGQSGLPQGQLGTLQPSSPACVWSSVRS